MVDRRVILTFDSYEIVVKDIFYTFRYCCSTLDKKKDKKRTYKKLFTNCIQNMFKSMEILFVAVFLNADRHKQKRISLHSFSVCVVRLVSMLAKENLLKKMVYKCLAT